MSDPERSAVSRAREAFERRAWEQACVDFSQAERDGPLEPADLDRYASAAYLSGRDAEGARLRSRAHKEHLDRGNAEAAVRSAFWLAIQLVDAGDMSQAGGWLARAHRLIEERNLDCAEQGYLLIAASLQSLGSGDAGAAYATFGQAEKIGERFGDPDLVSMARLGRGQSLTHLGEVSEGMALLDEVMVTVTSGELSVIPAGMLYCAVIEACFEVLDIRRAREWTEALSRWCDAQPDLVAYRGQCLARRAEVLQLQGDWPEAEAEARRALELLAGRPSAGLALYVQAELHRLRGEFSDAERVFRETHAAGRMPHPGLARLRLAQDQVAEAQSGLETVMQEAHDLIVRLQLLSAYVEVLLAAGEIDAAQQAAAELSGLAAELSAPFVEAVSRGTEGAVLLAAGEHKAALSRVREALELWQEIAVPYEAARTRVLLGRACELLGDRDGAHLEMDAARATFRRLGAAPDLAGIEAMALDEHGALPGGLTEREAEVLRLVAAGKSNRAIAGELFLSQKTVARHLSNIFTKLGVSSRSAATAFAYEHQLV